MPELELRSIHKLLEHPENGAIHRPALQEIIAQSLWTSQDSKGRLNVELYTMKPGEKLRCHYHRDHMEAVICWEGAGTVTIAENEITGMKWAGAYRPFAIKQYDSFIVPRGALHEIEVAPGTMRLVLIVLHALVDKAFTEETQEMTGDGGSTLPNGLKHDSLTPKKLKQTDSDPLHRAKRTRVWGRDGEGTDGSADIAKTDFQMTAYIFAPKQENPAHFHPYSVELMIGWTGETETYTRDKRWIKPEVEADEGWKTTRKVSVIRPGDTALVPLAAIHRYVNRTQHESIVVALQTPHPIMHTLEHETSF
jgi:quercetin dioxygenase-like cupin family protein